MFIPKKKILKKNKNSSSIGGSTDSDTNLSLGEKIENKQIFEDVNEIKNEDKIEDGVDEKKIDIFRTE